MGTILPVEFGVKISEEQGNTARFGADCGIFTPGEEGNVLNYGADRTGTTPSSAAILAALEDVCIAKVPSGTFLIDETIFVPDGCELLMERGATLVPTVDIVVVRAEHKGAFVTGGVIDESSLGRINSPAFQIRGGLPLNNGGTVSGLRRPTKIQNITIIGLFGGGVTNNGIHLITQENEGYIHFPVFDNVSVVGFARSLFVEAIPFQSEGGPSNINGCIFSNFTVTGPSVAAVEQKTEIVDGARSNSDRCVFSNWAIQCTSGNTDPYVRINGRFGSFTNFIFFDFHGDILWQYQENSRANMAYASIRDDQYQDLGSGNSNSMITQQDVISRTIPLTRSLIKGWPANDIVQTGAFTLDKSHAGRLLYSYDANNNRSLNVAKPSDIDWPQGCPVLLAWIPTVPDGPGEEPNFGSLLVQPVDGGSGEPTLLVNDTGANQNVPNFRVGGADAISYALMLGSGGGEFWHIIPLGPSFYGGTPSVRNKISNTDNNLLTNVFPEDRFFVNGARRFVTPIQDVDTIRPAYQYNNVWRRVVSGAENQRILIEPNPFDNEADAAGIRIRYFNAVQASTTSTDSQIRFIRGTGVQLILLRDDGVNSDGWIDSNFAIRAKGIVDLIYDGNNRWFIYSVNGCEITDIGPVVDPINTGP